MTSLITYFFNTVLIFDSIILNYCLEPLILLMFYFTKVNILSKNHIHYTKELIYFYINIKIFLIFTKKVFNFIII